MIFKFSGFVVFQGHNTPKDPIIKPNIIDWIISLNFVRSNDITLDNKTNPVTEPRVNTAIIFNLLIV